jgi:predicted DNA-binding transcriptional regulator AlpA
MTETLARDLTTNGLLHGLVVSGAFLDTFLRLDDVKRVTGLGRSTIYYLMSEDPPRFPRPVKIGSERGKAVAWLSSEITQWQRNRIAERDAVRAA